MVIWQEGGGERGLIYTALIQKQRTYCPRYIAFGAIGANWKRDSSRSCVSSGRFTETSPLSCFPSRSSLLAGNWCSSLLNRPSLPRSSADRVTWTSENAACYLSLAHITGSLKPCLTLFGPTYVRIDVISRSGVVTSDLCDRARSLDGWHDLLMGKWCTVEGVTERDHQMGGHHE